MSWTFKWREGQSCLITTWWWVGSSGRGGCQTDLVSSNKNWGWTVNIWWSSLPVQSLTQIPEKAFHMFWGRSGTWTPNELCSGLLLQLRLPGTKTWRSLVPVAVETKKLWRSPEVIESIKLKKEAFRAVLSQRTPKSSWQVEYGQKDWGSYSCRCKSMGWEEFGAK